MTELNEVKRVGERSDSTPYAYDPDLPYVVEREGEMVARFAEPDAAEHFTSQRYEHEVIDTTPKPRVPEDAEWITWFDSSGECHVAWYWGSTSRKWLDVGSLTALPLEDLPGVTPETVFTVLEERKS